MPEDVYSKLRDYLDSFPLGFPKTDSGVEMQLLRRLFTQDEAALELLLTPLPETPASIAERTGQAPDEIAPALEQMAKKGLIFRTRINDQVKYNSTPFMIGIYEYSVSRIDAELAALYRQYYEEAYQNEMGAGNVPGFKVFPVGKSIRGDITLLPYKKVEDEIRAARKISVAPCICRKEARLTGHGCRHSHETCLSFGVAAEYYIENGFGREIDAEEAIAILKKCDEEGLVHAGVNARHLSNICNCCPCCCASLKGIVEKDHDKIKYMNALYLAVVDPDACTGCGTCEDRCPAGVIAVGDVAAVDRGKCLGCGLCATGCPEEAIGIHLNEDRAEPFDRVMDLGKAILQGKQKQVGLSENQKTTLELLKFIRPD